MTTIPHRPNPGVRYRHTTYAVRRSARPLWALPTERDDQAVVNPENAQPTPSAFAFPGGRAGPERRHPSAADRDSGAVILSGARRPRLGLLRALGGADSAWVPASAQDMAWT